MSAVSPARAFSRSSLVVSIPGRGGEAKSLENLASYDRPIVVAQRSVPDVAAPHARQPLRIRVKLRDEPRDLRVSPRVALSGCSGQSNCPSNKAVLRRLPQHHRTCRAALHPRHLSLPIVNSASIDEAPIGLCSDCAAAGSRKGDAALRGSTRNPLPTIRTARNDCIVIVEEATFTRQPEQRGVGHL